MVKLVKDNPFVRMIELKLSQGAKPGKGGVLPGKKITAEIAKIRNVKKGVTVLSPSFHTAFSSIPEMVEFIEEIAEKTGVPVGIKSAVGKLDMWHELAKIMAETGRGPDFIAIDGGEGGTGAAPPSFADHVSLPFIYAFSEVYQLLQSYDLTKKTTMIASGKLGFPGRAAMAFAMGADSINIAREAMISVGCIQAQKCHDNTCPAGIATQKKWLQKGINVEVKAERFGNYVKTLRKELLEVTFAAGYEHPSGLTMDDVKLSMGDNNRTMTLEEIFGYKKDKVEWKGAEHLMCCPHLGAKGVEKE
ncbi:MAG: glutamate synthase domain-containing protein 2 [Gammaproteobacteria bacterium]